MKRNENEIDKRNEPIRMNMGWWIMKMAAFAITVWGLLGGEAGDTTGPVGALFV